MEPVLAALACVAARGVRARGLCERLAAGPDAALRELAELDPESRILAVESARRWAHICERVGIAIAPAWSQPVRLRRGPLAPAVTFWRGGLVEVAHPTVAIIGARAAGAEATSWAGDLAHTLARRGVLIVSGGARGIDAAAHRGAVEAGGVTLAVVGVAADRLYPAANRRLFSRLLARRGAIVSEHPPGTRTLAYEHAQRNRLIAMLADTVVVAEASADSGTRGAVAVAASLGVPIWISPEGIGGQRSGLEAYRSAYGARPLLHSEQVV